MLRIATSPIEERPWHTAKPNLFARGSPIRGNNDDHRQWRKQGVVVGAAASKTQVLFKARSECWVPQPGQWHCEAMTERASPLITPHLPAG